MMNFYSLQNHHQTSTPLKYTTRKTHIEVSLDSYGLQLFAGASYMEDGGAGERVRGPDPLDYPTRPPTILAPQTLNP